MTGNNVFALPLGLMGMLKSEWGLCSLLCAELVDVHCHKAKDTIRALAYSWPIPFMNTSEFNYDTVTDIMEHYI